MTATSLRLMALFAALLVILPGAENVAVKRQVVQPEAPKSGSFYRGAVESPPPTIQAGRGFQRDAVEYRPNPDFRPLNPISLKYINSDIFLSQFFYPSLYADHFRKFYPDHYATVVLPEPAIFSNSIIQKGKRELDDGFVKSNDSYFMYIVSADANDCLNGQAMRPNPDDCSGYQICNHGVWQNQKCADGLHWNAEFSICDWPSNVRCAITNTPSVTTPQALATEAPQLSTTTPRPPISSTTPAPSPVPVVTSTTTTLPKPSVTPPASTSSASGNLILPIEIVLFIKSVDFNMQARLR